MVSALMKKATRQQTKTHNQKLVLKTIYQQGQVSRADIARLTHLTRTTVSNLVAEIIDDRLVEEVGLEPSTGGKPATLLSVIDDSRHLLGIDLANSEFRGGILDLRGRVKHRFNLPVNDRNGEAALELAYELIDELVTSATSPLLGIGIGTPGLIDARRGVVRQAVNLDWQELRLRDLLESRYNVPVYIANDSQVAALGEYTFGQNSDTSNLVVVKVGRGIGAGIVINGHLYYGDGFGAGEIGHVMVTEDGELCRCGHFGCLETIVSSQSIISQAQAIASNDPDSVINKIAGRPEGITTETVLRAVETGDPALGEVVERTGYYLSIAVANLVGVLNIQRVVIAGSVARLGQPLLEPIRREFRQRAMEMLANETRIELSQLGQDIVIQGAAALLLTQELGIV
jgi:glucokinase-like ROK family protein